MEIGDRQFIGKVGGEEGEGEKGEAKENEEEETRAPFKRVFAQPVTGAPGDAMHLSRRAEEDVSDEKESRDANEMKGKGASLHGRWRR